MLARKLSIPQKSFFLLGPRGTGKSTWLRAMFPQARWYNLLRNIDLLRLMQNPEIFRQEVDALPDGTWVVIDEIQRLPSLLNEVHDIIATRPKNAIQFALTGSSARKLKRSGVNLLAGRALQRKMFPLTSDEIGQNFDLEQALRFGTLPDSYLAKTDLDRIEYLESYLNTYLREEIKEEALIRKLEPFARFLRVAAIMNGQQTNLSAISRDAVVSRPTVDSYFEVLTDTLIGFWLPAWQPKAKIKEVAKPKFYFFDTGVARGLSGGLREKISDIERGHLFETLILNEMRAWIANKNTGGELNYWRTPSGSEIDIIYCPPGIKNKPIGIEIKSSKKWKPEYSRVLKERLEDHTLAKGWGVYCGDTPLKDGPVDVLGWKTFLTQLWSGQLLIDQ
jgi:uncharacterized protein